jgi:hypothetical protein
MCKWALHRANTGFVQRKSHKQLDLEGLDAFYGPKSGAFCQNPRKTGWVFAPRHQISGPSVKTGIQAK